MKGIAVTMHAVDSQKISFPFNSAPNGFWSRASRKTDGRTGFPSGTGFVFN